MNCNKKHWLRAIGRALALAAAPVCIFLLSAQSRAEDKTQVVEIKIRTIDANAAAQVSFERDIKPMLVNACYECHSAEDHKGGLDVTDSANLFKKGKKAGPPVVPGKPDESAMVQYIRGERTPQMPKGNPALSESELHLIRQWIAAGAVIDTGKLAKQKPSTANTTTNAKVSSDLVNDLLFSDNYERRLIAQRKIRTALLPPAPVLPKAGGPVFNPIDQFIEAKWQQAGLKEARHAPPVCSDTAFLRRVYLDLIGTVPTVAEAKHFINDTASDKRAKLVDGLLARSDDYAANWTPFWEDALGSADVDKTGGIATRGNHRDWIYRSFKENKPYDVMVAELIDPKMPGYQKPVISEANGKRVFTAYIRNESHTDTLGSASDVAQVFLGTSMKCASCHSHFLNKEWPQSRFLAFAGMFAAKDLELIRCEKKSGQYIPAKFPFELPGVPDDVPKDLDGRLHRLTQLLADPTNPRFAKALVNRLWKRYIGIGLFAPVDDFRLDQPPSHPELLDWLADDFIRSGYDLKHTIRLILTSRTYQLKYNPALEDHFDAAKPLEARYFRSPSLRRLTAEELVDSINLAASQKMEPRLRLYLKTQSTALTRALGKPASRNEISTGRSEEVAVVQALELLNGTEYHAIVYEGPVIKEASSEKDALEAARRLYWCALSRPPTPKEEKLAVAFLTGGEKGGLEKERLGDMFWALCSSPEFEYIH